MLGITLRCPREKDLHGHQPHSQACCEHTNLAPFGSVNDTLADPDLDQVRIVCCSSLPGELDVKLQSFAANASQHPHILGQLKNFHTVNLYLFLFRRRFLVQEVRASAVNEDSGLLQIWAVALVSLVQNIPLQELKQQLQRF